MKRLLVLAAFAAVALVPALAQAGPYLATGDQVKLISVGGQNGGGEFNFAIKPGDDVPDFKSFCLELGEHISVGGTYYVKVATFADAGGIGGPNDPLDFRTAYLYSNFRAGTLAGYTGSVLTQSALQLAIWRIEQEVDANYNGLSDVATRTQAEVFYQAAVAAGWTNLGNVRVAQLWANRDFTGHAQDILTTVPEPASMALLGLGLVGLAGAARRRASK